VAEFPALLISGDLLSQGSNLNGRRWAGKTLLQAWAAHLGDWPLHVACGDPCFAGAIEPLAREAGHSGAIQAHGLVDPEPYAAIGGLFIPDPSIGRWARWRQAIGAERFSLIGQIHTLNTPASLGHLEALASEPIQPWDALICTSTAGRAVVEAVFNDREQQLQERFSIQTPLPRPQLPVIPLPIPVDTMQRQLPARAAARQQLEIPANAHVCIWLGRLSLLTKLDPWPSYQLLQRLAADLQQPLWLIECGPDDTPEQGRHFAELRQLCPDVHFLRLGGAEPVDEATKYQALAAADLALSLVDNCQETFGLSVIEAMAAGLPVVASDWDGYRDSVRHGVDGFLVPTRWAAGSESCSVRLGWQQQLELLSFPVVSGALGQLVQLNMPTARAHLATLLQNPSLARAMGQQGRRRAEQRFASSVIMEQYAQLFAELAERRREALAMPQQAARPPLSLDPVHLFRHFASQPADQPWPAPETSSLSPAVASNRQALWQPLLESLSAAQRQKLLQELQRKHL
jgi:starch synthase